jgi:hypothetical protein
MRNDEYTNSKTSRYFMVGWKDLRVTVRAYNRRNAAYVAFPMILANCDIAMQPKSDRFLQVWESEGMGSCGIVTSAYQRSRA